MAYAPGVKRVASLRSTGRALDIWNDTGRTPTFRWTSYDSDLDAYQGALLHKEEYVRTFLAAAERGATYNYSYLAQLWDHLIAACTA